ncbi:PREDICTED: F-box protein At5g41720-like [Camelina sativa]|uniref:F-box protein At5g41720-like n=1 Tax=Camelina sativa TaxID=90675 RepID=A0ABM0USU5_CAMSA|nr:PREDICTED: F-box protein At5g41720-like [Camelina sativa]
MLNQDVIQEILSHCSATEIARFRLQNKECNKRSYELRFIDHHLHRANSVFGYFVHYEDKWFRYRPRFVPGVEAEQEEKEDKTQISLQFLPQNNAKIQACDTHHGILLCIGDRFKGAKTIPEYIVCKPATKQFRIIPNPKTRYLTIATGLMVISLTPFWYKIIRVSEPRTWMNKEGFYNHNCEVFDSDSFAWKRLNDFELSEFFPREAIPVSTYDFLHWLTRKNNVIRFCMRTKTWSIFSVPDVLLGDNSLILVSYEGKLGVTQYSESRNGAELWVLENSLRKSWVKVEDAKITALEDDYVQPFWFPSSDVVSVAASDRLGLYNMNSNNC